MSFNKKIGDAFLAVVMPLIIIYVSTLCLWSYFIETDPARGGFIDVVVVFVCSFLITHGVLSIYFHFKRSGFLDFIKKIFFLK